MGDIIRENWSVLLSYTGTKLLFALYVPAFVFLLLKEKERWKRYLFVYAPGLLLMLFLFSPLRRLYDMILNEADTYYRLLWLVPFGMTISYAAVTAAERYRVALFAVTAAAVVLGGSLVYRDAIVSRAENRFHLSQVMIDVANTVLTHRDADEDTAIGVCLPPEFVQQVRQYDGRFYMPFGRAEVHWGYTGNLAYNLYTAEVIDMEELDAELRRRSIPYLVISDAKSVSLSPAQKGWEEIDALHGYRVWCRKEE